jgi:acyl dehydratase
MMEQVLQFVGALGILAPFALLQFRLTSAHSWLYLSANAAGAAILTWLALIESQWGFVILQGVWTLAALIGLAHRVRGLFNPAQQGDG